jgi:hypothetical protein
MLMMDNKVHDNLSDARNQCMELMRGNGRERERDRTREGNYNNNNKR